MANIAVQKENQRELLPSRDWLSPFRTMQQMLRWDPFAEMLPWTEAERAAFLPDFDVKETKNAFLFKADLPGIEEKDIQVNLTDNRLTIQGKREEEKEEKGDTTYRCERSFGSFSRAFTLPGGSDAEKVTAELKKGVLTVTVPKKPEARPKEISVKSA